MAVKIGKNTVRKVWLSQDDMVADTVHRAVQNVLAKGLMVTPDVEEHIVARIVAWLKEGSV